MRVPVWPIRRAGSWREATPSFSVIVMNIVVIFEMLSSIGKWGFSAGHAHSGRKLYAI